MNKKLISILIIILFSFCVLACQYIAELANAAYSTSKPANGHSWAEMECTEGLCVDSVNNRVGIGTSTPGYKLDIAGAINATGNISSAGTITATTDVCNGAGACLSQLNSFIGSQPLVNSTHTYTACSSAGGIVTSINISYPICLFNASSCPSGWTQYLNWSKTQSSTCAGQPCGGCCASSCTTGQHDWSNAAVETCSYNYGTRTADGQYCTGTGTLTCPATVLQIGCY